MNLKKTFYMANLWEQNTGVKGTIWVCTKHTKYNKPQLIYVVRDEEFSVSIEDVTVLTPKIKRARNLKFIN